jgi:predicted N-acetyltransferase YhbS
VEWQNPRLLLVAPINGSTWNGYRFVIGGTDRAPFFLEPRNPPEWTQDLSSAGFAPCATYYSAATRSLDYEDPRLHEIERRLHDAGVTMRCLERSRVADELRRVYALARTSFRHNFLYTVPSEDEFLGMYMKLLDFVRPEYVLLAEHDGDLVGFAFALPDHGQQTRGEAVETLILKTVSVRPGRAYAGLGRRLICEVNEAAKRDGYRTVIHALMHESNASLAYSQRFTRVFRRYAVYARRIS